MQELLFVQAKSTMAPWAFYTHRIGIIVSSREMRESLCERHVLTWMLSTLESSATCSHCLLDRVSLCSPSCLGTNCRQGWPQKSEVHSISLEFRLKACAQPIGKKKSMCPHAGLSCFFKTQSQAYLPGFGWSWPINIQENVLQTHL